LDASEGGGDVFFLTSSRLTVEDLDTAYDIYDAHECSVAVPCVAPVVSPPACDSSDSCKAAPSVQPAVFGAPASAPFSGSGNVVGSASGPAVRARSLTRVTRGQALARALRACRREPRRRRAGCERRARMRYRAGAVRGVRVSASRGRG
jgi:hypothetical protein